MDGRKIIGIMLVRNEDLFIEQVLNNVRDFCDGIIVADNMSTDQTAEKVQAQISCDDKIVYHKISHPSQSHDLVSCYAGGDVWIFGIDGDELYDPGGLMVMREKIMSRDFDDYWMILGNVLNCVEFDPERKQARGYLAPPCRSVTKLYNFSVIESWAGPSPERLHGGTLQFKPGYTEMDRLHMNKAVSWEESIFRCLHLCFLPRSTADDPPAGSVVMRKNIADVMAESFLQRCMSRLRSCLNVGNGSANKKEKYMRGELVQKDITPFIPSAAGCHAES